MHNHIAVFTALRFFAATSVVLFHYGTHLFPSGGMLVSLVKKGNLAVSFFYFLSGVVLYIAYHSKDFTRVSFYKKRVYRIYPTYLVTLILTLVIGMLLMEQFPPISVIFCHLIAIQAWIPDQVLALNTPGWSISVEFFFYLLFPTLLFFSRKKSTFYFSAFVGLLWLLSMVLFYFQIKQSTNSYMLHFLAYSPTYHLSTFIFGMMGGVLICRYPKLLPIVWNRMLWTGGLVLIVGIILLQPKLAVLGHNGLFAPLYCMLLYGLANESDKFIQISDNPITNHLGVISFSMYLLQYPIFMIFNSLFKSELSLFQFGLYFITLLSMSHLSYRFIETPNLSKKLPTAKSVF